MRQHFGVPWVWITGLMKELLVQRRRHHARKNPREAGTSALHDISCRRLPALPRAGSNLDFAGGNVNQRSLGEGSLRMECVDGKDFKIERQLESHSLRLEDSHIAE